MNKLFNLIKNFRKNECVNKAVNTDFNTETIDLTVMGSVLESISYKTALLPCSSLLINIEDFESEKIEPNMFMYNKLISKVKPISVIDVSYNNYKQSLDKKLYIVIRLFALSTDNGVLKFTFRVSCKYKSLLDNIDEKITDIAIEYVNGFIRTKNLEYLTQNNIQVSKLSEFNSTSTENYTGYIKRFSMNTENRALSPEDDIDINVDKVVTDTYSKDDSIMVDVVRKKDKIRINDII